MLIKPPPTPWIAWIEQYVPGEGLPNWLEKLTQKAIDAATTVRQKARFGKLGKQEQKRDSEIESETPIVESDKFERRSSWSGPETEPVLDEKPTRPRRSSIT